MSPLRGLLEEYLALRRTLGFTLIRAARLLPDFVASMEQHHAPTITTPLALAWAQQPPAGPPAWWAERLSLVRGFARYVQAFDARTEVPPPSLVPAHRPRAIPYIYSDRDLARVLAAARQLHPRLRADTYTTLIGLLATTGLRVGEAIRLDRQDVLWAPRLLIVRDSKFGKSREVPLHDTTAVALRAYAGRRDRRLRARAPSFFLSTAGTRLIYQNVHHTFFGLVGRAGLPPRAAGGQPRPHDLRHTFAVRTVLGWYQAGLDVEARLPQLSTYLGHSAPSSTYWYLSATPALMALVVQRLERARGARP